MTTTISINDSDRQVLLELYEHLRGYYDTKHQKCPCCGASTGAKSFTTPLPKDAARRVQYEQLCHQGLTAIVNAQITFITDKGCDAIGLPRLTDRP